MKRIILVCTVASLTFACDKKPEQNSATTTAGSNSEPAQGSEELPSTIEEARALRDEGALDRAAKGYAALEPSAESWLGELEIASMQRRTKKLNELLDSAELSALDDATKRAAFLLSYDDATSHGKVGALGKELCAPAPGAADAALDTACARLTITKVAPRKCVEGCEGAQTIGVYPAAYPIVKASINGSEPLRFGVFGSAPMTLTPAAVQKLGLERTGEPFSIESSGTAVTVHHVVADIDLGDVAWKDVPFVELDLADEHIDGGIGIDDLFDRNVELDLSALELRLGGPKSEGLTTSPMARIDSIYTAWGSLDDRPARPFAVSVGNSALLLTDAYHASGTELPVGRTVQAPCAGDVACTRRVVESLDKKLKLAGQELGYGYAMISEPQPVTDDLLDIAGYAGATPYRGRILRFDREKSEFGISDVVLPPLEKGDSASFTIGGSRVERPATLFEGVVEPGEDFVDINQIFESEEAHDQFRIQVAETHQGRGGFLHTRRPLSTFAANPEFGTKQIGTDEYEQALTPYHARYRTGPTIHISPVDWTIDGSPERCLEVRSEAQVGPSEFGIVEFVQCPAAKWRMALFKVSAGDEVIFEMRRDGAVAGDGATIR